MLQICNYDILSIHLVMEQLNLFSSKPNKKEEIVHAEVENGEYIYLSHFFNTVDSNRYFTHFLESIHWKQEEMKIYGKTVKFPRLTAWYGDNDKPYTFSGITLTPENWTKELVAIKELVEERCQTVFNSVLLNLYRDGSDSISWHTDAEKELGEHPVIVSVSFGATRKFQLRHKETKERIDIELQHGSVLIMQGALQHYWQHQIPKTKKQVGKRINLTFRYIK